MKYRTFHVGLLALYCDEEPKRVPKFGGLVRILATTCRKIRGAESLEEIQYLSNIHVPRHGMHVAMLHVACCNDACCGCSVVQLVESWVYNPEDTGSSPRAGGNKNITSTPAHLPTLGVP